MVNNYLIVFFFLNKFFWIYLDQNKDGQINRKDMIKIIEAMYDLANEEDRSGDKAPDKRVDLIMQRLNKDKSGKKIPISNFLLVYFDI